MWSKKFQEFQARLVLAASADDGMSTAEYAIGTIAAAAFGAILYTVVTESQDRLLCRGRCHLLPNLTGPPWGGSGC